MRFKNVLLFSLVLLFMVFIDSCNNNSALIYTGAKIQTIKDCIHGTTYTYTYNSDGSIANVVETYGNKSIYTYPGDSIVEQNLNSLGVMTNGKVYFVNSKKLADSATGMVQTANNSWSYNFDANYYPLQINYYSYHKLFATDNFNIVGKNISYIEHVNTSNNTKTYDYYDYYAANGNTLGNQAIGEDFLGVQTANLIKDNVKIGNNSDTTDIIIYRYRFDTSSRPDTLATYHRNNGPLIDSFIYTYTN